MQIKLNQEVAAGSLFMFFGGAGLYFGMTYHAGSLLRMGPGYFPRMLSAMLVGLGLLMALRGFIQGGEPIARLHLRPMSLISAGIVAFAALVDRAGLLVAVVSAVVLGALGGQEFRFREVAVLGIGLAAGAAAVFVYALGLPIQILPFAR